MTYTPKNKRGLGAFISFVGLFLSVFCAYLEIRLKVYIFAVISFSLVLFSLQLLFRFCFTKYIYSLDGQNLIVYTTIGEKKNRIFDISLLLAVGIADKKEGRKLKKTFGKIKRSFNVCQNLFPKQKYYIVYNNGLKMSVCLECDEAFANEIKKQIPSYFV